MIRCKRAYETPSPDDGQRVLVDRLWPRNRRKDQLDVVQWLPELAPSNDLRKAFHQGEVDFAGFAQCYRKELTASPQHWMPLLDMARSGDLTLVYASADSAQNNAVVLADWLEDELERHGPGSSPVCYADEVKAP